MAALFKELARQAGLLTTTTEEIGLQDGPSLEPRPLAFDASQEEEGVTHMADHPSMPEATGSIPEPNFVKVDEVGELLTSLFRLPKSSGWVEEDRAWWQQAVFSAVSRLSQELAGQETAR